MKRKLLFILLFVFILFSFNSIAYFKQNSADIFYFEAGIGGTTNYYDNNYNTWAYNSVDGTTKYINLTYSISNLTSAIWEIGTHNGTTANQFQNLTIPQNCLLSQSLNLKVNIYRLTGASNGIQWYYCYNNTNEWDLLLYHNPSNRGWEVTDEALYYDITQSPQLILNSNITDLGTNENPYLFYFNGTSLNNTNIYNCSVYFNDTLKYFDNNLDLDIIQYWMDYDIIINPIH